MIKFCVAKYDTSSTHVSTIAFSLLIAINNLFIFLSNISKKSLIELCFTHWILFLEKSSKYKFQWDWGCNSQLWESQEKLFKTKSILKPQGEYDGSNSEMEKTCMFCVFLHLPGLKVLLRRASLKTKETLIYSLVKFLKFVLIKNFNSVLEKINEIVLVCATQDWFLF